MSEKSLHSKFGRGLQGKDKFSFSFDKDFKIESYLHHQGYRFVERFDPNSYLYLTKATDYFDLEPDYDGKLSNAFVNFAYQDKAFPIGEGQTISQPYTVAFQSQLLELKPG